MILWWQNMASLFPRWIEPRISEALLDTPVVLLAGPRQAGKTTLVRQIAEQQRLRYLTMDDELTLLSAREDPVGMIRSLDRAVIDEIQRAPQLLLAIKKSVDEDRRPGRFLLTGSANLMALPTIADSLAGRMETLSLLPLSQSEIELHSANWIDAAFAGRILKVDQPALGNDLIERVLRGGYPEAISRASAKRRVAWARQYIDAIIQRDVRDVAGIEKLDHLPRFLRALAQTAGQMCNYTQLGGQVGLDGKTASRYIGVFEQMYLLKRIDVWARNRLNRVVKTSKLQFIDSGLLAALLDLTAQEAGVSKGALLYHFPSKQALIKGMIQYYLERFTAEFNATAQEGSPDSAGRWTRAYLKTTYEGNQRNPRMSSGLLAAVATDPALLSPMQQTFAEWVKLLEQDGIDPITAQIVRLAVDGLWMVELFGLAPPDTETREKVLNGLHALIDRPIDGN